MATTPGQRVYLVRLALGDGVKNPMSLADFAAMIKRKRKAVYDPSALSRLENGKRAMTTDDAEHIAAVDPDKRGAAWLAFGEPEVEGRPSEQPFAADLKVLKEETAATKRRRK